MKQDFWPKRFLSAVQVNLDIYNSNQQELFVIQVGQLLSASK